MLNKDVHHQSSAQQANVQLELTPKYKGCPMGFRSALVLVSTVGLFTLGFLAPWGAPKAVADGDRLGCGTYCQNAGGYGAAGNVTLPPPAVTLVSTSVTADADGYVPVTLRCNLPVQCRGVLRLSGQFQAIDAATGNAIHPVVAGASDLLVNAGATRTIGVPLSRPGALPGAASAIALLRSHGPTTLDLLIDSAQAPGTDGYVRTSADYGFLMIILGDKLTVAAPG
jgi:hypothetical protein